jgi:hypothetical protein
MTDFSRPDGRCAWNSPALPPPFDIFVNMKKVEWDTLLFFYGVTSLR